MSAAEVGKADMIGPVALVNSDTTQRLKGLKRGSTLMKQGEALYVNEWHHLLPPYCITYASYCIAHITYVYSLGHKTTKC